MEGGKPVKKKDAMVYLGSLLTAGGRIQSELSRIIGAARRVFKELETVWRHTNLTRQWKIKVYSSCVLSKLMYSLRTSWLNEAELKCLGSRAFARPQQGGAKVRWETAAARSTACPE